MSTTKSKETLTRLAWLAALRQRGHRQCRGVGRDGSAHCALGLLWYTAGYPQLDDLSTVAALAGLADQQAKDVMSLNDGRAYMGSTYYRAEGAPVRQHTFAEIADVVASWFPND